ncbi:hypothetical protein F53441_3083 [Fusarium austroafricanum]|uniref:Uncharacterized protein n=1 Tax=Fusarium austroafricanum TaxID=2364996 RepID=A0A8H4P399_9HYPO|nr:hypothetical protein F53441_3083 [Fusarium austroafricanum]
MAPSQFFFCLRRGITGGFAPPTPSLIITVSADDGVEMQISKSKPSDGAPEESKTVARADHEALVDELYDILRDLPTEDPPGSEDIYKLDTSISWGSDALEWQNGAPQGCDGGESEILPTEEDIQKFKRAIDIVQEIANA